MTITVAYEDTVVSIDGETDGEALWVSPEVLARALGWEVKPEGLCRGPLCVPLRSGVVRTDGAVDLAALARQRGQTFEHDAGHAVWVFGPGAAPGGPHSVLAPDFTLPDLAGQRHTLSVFRGRKVLLNSWASW